MIELLTEVTTDKVISEKSLDDIYSAIMDLSSDVSGLKRQVSVLQEEVVELQELVGEKLNCLLETLQNMPQYQQLQIIIAFLLMLVFFELMRLLKSWTSSFRMKGGK